VHELLQTEFGLADGLADTATWREVADRLGFDLPQGVEPESRFVTIADPALGTGTFLVEAIEVIHRTLLAKWRDSGRSESEIQDLWNEYVPEHLLPRLHGYELMMAPYAIAHLKLGLKLFETGYRFENPERVRVFLTNALEPASDSGQMQLEGLAPALAHEAAAVNEIKRVTVFTVIIGNPPYSIVSANFNPWIVELCEAYKVTVRQRERQIQALSDDYVKFIRLAHWLMEQASAGVVGMITNNGFLDGHLFVDMRASLASSFRLLQILNLHGNLRTRERTPAGDIDENVFDIQTGVTVTLAAKLPPGEPQRVTYLDLWGQRETKYELLVEGGGWDSWIPLGLDPPSAPWIPLDRSLEAEWSAMPSLPEIFGTGDLRQDAQRRYAAGFVSQQDGFAIAFTPDEIVQRVDMLLDPAMTEEELRTHYKLCTTSQWSFERAREELGGKDIERLITACVYRPFDTRYTVFHRGVVSILRKELMRHLYRHQNVALLATRGISRQVFAHAFAVSGPVDRHALDNASESMFVFPLFVYPDSDVNEISGGVTSGDRVVNFSSKFLHRISENLGHAPEPDSVFSYLYAVLHSQAYRIRFADQLRVDFPRLPVPPGPGIFRALSELGARLRDAHLLAAPLPASPAEYVGPKDPPIVRVAWSNDTVWLDAPRTRNPSTDIGEAVGCFRGISEAVWSFHIGGYQVCHKWLKDRKGRTLSSEDIAHYSQIVSAISETIHLVAEVDAVIHEHGGCPDAFADPKATALGSERHQLEPSPNHLLRPSGQRDTLARRGREG
jgi:predicted helicase